MKPLFTSPRQLPSFAAAAVLAATAALASLTAPAAAQQPDAATMSALRSNCRSDFMSNCSGVSPGGRDALVCLQTHIDKLSPACRTAVSATLPKAAPPAAAAPAAAPPAAAAAPPAPAAATPPPKAATPAPAAAPPPPKAAAAPAPKAATVAPPKAAPPPKRAAVAPPPPAAAATPVRIRELPLRERAAISRICDADRAAQCKMVRPGGNRIVECLVMHRDALTPSCRAAVAKAIQ